MFLHHSSNSAKQLSPVLGGTVGYRGDAAEMDPGSVLVLYKLQGQKIACSALKRSMQQSLFSVFT